MLFSWRDKIWFFSCWKYLIYFLFWTKYFSKWNFKFTVTFEWRGLKGQALNLDILETRPESQVKKASCKITTKLHRIISLNQINKLNQTIAELRNKYFAWRFSRFWEVILYDGFQNYPKKLFPKLVIKSLILAQLILFWCLCFIEISGHSVMCLAWRARSSRPKGIFTKHALKNVAKFLENIYAAIFLLL